MSLGEITAFEVQLLTQFNIMSTKYVNRVSFAKYMQTRKGETGEVKPDRIFTEIMQIVLQNKTCT